MLSSLTWASPRFWSREAHDAPQSGTFDDAGRAFSRSARSFPKADSAAMSTNGLVESVAWPAHAVWSNIHAGTSSQRSVSDPLSVQRKTTPPALSIVPWIQTRRPNHGCHRYKSSRKPVPWAFSNLVVQPCPAASMPWPRTRRWFVLSSGSARSSQGRSSADFIMNTAGRSIQQGQPLAPARIWR